MQLARTLMGDPGLLLLDEPAAGLDLAGREDLVHRLGVLAADPAVAPTVLVTHHTEEIPDGFTHALLLRDGKVLVAGPLADVLTEANLSACFDLPLRLERRDGRWLSWAARLATATRLLGTEMWPRGTYPSPKRSGYAGSMRRSTTTARDGTCTVAPGS